VALIIVAVQLFCFPATRTPQLPLSLMRITRFVFIYFELSRYKSDSGEVV
jgi:hypothetical protein